MKAWNDKQYDLMQQGMEEKEVTNISVDKRRSRDFDYLKILGGRFTSSEQENEYMEDETIDEMNKNKRLYLEVRYARDKALGITKVKNINIKNIFSLYNKMF